MTNQKTSAGLPPHVLIFPAPLQSHVQCMLNLAELLCLSDLHVTIILTDFTHARLLRHGSLHSRFSRHPGFRVAAISDGLAASHPRSGEGIMEVLLSLREVGGPQFRQLMESTDALSDGGARRRVSRFIMDGGLSFTVPVVDEMGIPYIYFRTISACSFWAYFCFQEVIDAGEIPPLKGKDESKLEYWNKEEMELMVTSIPGMDGILRRRDLPGFCRVADMDDPVMQAITTETKNTAQGRGFILNTFEDLEAPILDQIRKHIPNLYSIGPLHAHLQARLEAKGMQSQHYSSSFWDEDRSCIAWLNSQPNHSVIYVSFGSVTTLTRDELMEFWYGLVNSGKKFLWVVRPDSIIAENNGNENENGIPVELAEGTKLRGLMVGWAPQHEVLAHPAIGAFFTHSGWNSCLESIVSGIPMVCWAYFADQMTNSRFVSEVWKTGVDMKDSCDRVLIEKVIKDVMEVTRHEFLERSRSLFGLSKKAIAEDGSSFNHLNRLIEFLKSE